MHHAHQGLPRHADAAEHRELPAAQSDVRRDGIEHIRRRNQRDQDDEPAAEYPHNDDDAALILTILGVVKEIRRCEMIGAQSLVQRLACPQMIAGQHHA